MSLRKKDCAHFPKGDGLDRLSWSGTSGDVFTKPDDGILNDHFRSWVEHKEGVGTTVYFHPILADRIYDFKEGLSTDTDEPEIISSVPILGDSRVGSFFRSADVPDTNTELIVFISVALVNPE